MTSHNSWHFSTSSSFNLSRGLIKISSWKQLRIFAGSLNWLFILRNYNSIHLHWEQVIKPNDREIKCNCDKVRAFCYLFGYRLQLLYVSHVHTSISAFLSTDPSLAATTLVLNWQTGCRKGRAPRWRSQAFSIIPCCDTWLVAPEPYHMMEVVSSNRKLLDLLFLSRCFMAALIVSPEFSFLFPILTFFYIALPY